MFKNAIVRIPCQNMVKGISSANLGLPDYELALDQHQAYCKALKSCGLEVHILPPLEQFPDSTFIEDVAVLTPFCAVITRPGAETRRAETEGMEDLLRKYFGEIEHIKAPGTLEAGDVMKAGAHFYIGLSGRTNQEGADQLISILQKYGITASTVRLEKVLHLKTGLAYLENNKLLASGEFLEMSDFKKFNLIEIPVDDSYSTNSIWVNHKVLIAKGFPGTREKIEKAGYETIELDVSEFRKLDGGLSCLSLRF
jgi:dimethylargininase